MSAKIYILVLVLFLFFTYDVYAAFSIQTNLNSIDFGTMNPNEIKGDLPSQGLTVTCTSDSGNSWQLRVHLDGYLTNTNNPSAIIPNENFIWYVKSTTGSATPTQDEQDFLQERVVYTAPTGEGASGVDITLQFKLKTPPNAQSGSYVGTIILTMIE